MIRKPVVSGQFYPGDPLELDAMVQAMVRPGPLSKTVAKGIILPHAGYIYSGNVAASTVNKVVVKDKLILLGPNHTGIGADFALYDKGSWQIPLGEIPIDETIAQKIVAAGDMIAADTTAHRAEHSLEVELPILFHFNPGISIVPIACKPARNSVYRAVAQQICRAVKNNNSVMFVVSTDMTHYEPDAAARKKDSLAIEQIINIDPEGLSDTVRKNNISMCGEAPTAVFLYCMKEMAARKAQVVLYQTSGDAGGDKTSVVGYVGIMVQ